MKLGKILSYLIDNSKSSLSSLAQNLGLDQGQISAWVKDQDLPDEDDWPDIKASMVDFFNDKLSLSQLDRMVQVMPYLIIYRKDMSKEDFLEAVLEGSYQESDRISALEDEGSGLDMTDYVHGQGKISQLITRQLLNELYQGQSSSIFYSGNLIPMLEDRVVDNYQVSPIITNQTWVKFSFSQLDLEEEETNKQNDLAFFSKYLLAISNLSAIKFELYRKQDASDHQVQFSSKDSFHGWGFDLKEGRPATLFITQQEDIVQNNYYDLAESFEEYEEIFTIKFGFQEIMADLRPSKAGQPALFYSRNLYLYFASADLMDKIYQEDLVQDRDLEYWKMAQSMLNSYVFKKAKILVTRTSILQTLHKGWVDKFNGKLRLHGDFLKEFIDDIYDMLNKGRILVIDDLNLENSNRLPDCCLYADGSSVVLTKGSPSNDYDLLDYCYYSSDQEFADLAYRYNQGLTSLKDNNFLNY